MSTVLRVVLFKISDRFDKDEARAGGRSELKRRFTSATSLSCAISSNRSQHKASRTGVMCSGRFTPDTILAPIVIAFWTECSYVLTSRRLFSGGAQTGTDSRFTRCRYRYNYSTGMSNIRQRSD